MFGFGNNDDLSTAQAIDASFIDLGNGVQRAAVNGELQVDFGLPVTVVSKDSSNSLTNWTTYSNNPDAYISQDGSGIYMQGDYTNYQPALTEALWNVDLSSLDNATLSYWISNSNQGQPFAGAYVDHYNADGVSVSSDGSHWIPVYNQPTGDGNLIQHQVDLGAALAGSGLVVGDIRFVKFQQYSGGASDTSNRSWDGITITTQVTGMRVPASITVSNPDFGGNLNLLANGQIPAQQTDFNGPGSVFWFGHENTGVDPLDRLYFQYDLGSIVKVQDLLVSVDNNDTYDVEWSVNGFDWQTLVVIPEWIGSSGYGMDTFSSRTGDARYDSTVDFTPVEARYLRISVEGGDGAYAVGELQALGENQDWYSVNLYNGELTTFAVAGLEGSQNLKLDLFDADGNWLATGTADATNTDAAIRDFRAQDNAAYFVRVSGSTPGDYNLVVTRHSAFERENNDTTPQDISQTGRVLGHLDGVINVAILDSNSVDEGILQSSSGIATQLLNQLNDSQWDANFDINFPINAQQVTFDQIDTLEELNQFDVVFIGASGTHSDLQTIAPVLRQWVEAGGGLIASAPITNQAGQNYGTPIADIDAIVPVNTSVYASDRFDYTNLNITNGSHPITQGVSDFYVYGIESDTPDAGSSVLATYSGYPAVVVGHPGQGRSVFLAPYYSNSSDELGYGDADRLVEQAVAWASGSSIDRYQFQAVAGDTVSIYTLTPGDGPDEPANTLDTGLTLYGPDGSLIPATDYTEFSPDGRNATLVFTVPETGAYTVAVNAEAGTGAYQLSVDNDHLGGEARVSAFQVASSQPGPDALLLAYPSTYRITLSEQVLLNSIEAGDLTINGIAAGTVTVVDGNTLEFGIANTVGEADLYVVAIADGALTSLSGQGLTAYTTTIDMDADTQPYPVPLATVQPDGSLIYDPAITGYFHTEGDEDDYTLELEAGQVLTVSLSTDDARLRGEISLLGPDGTSVLALALASGHGQTAVLQTAPIAEAGTYTIRVRADRGLGIYQLAALLNAAQEVEARGQGGWNETQADAQTIDGSFINIDSNTGEASRGAVRGELTGTRYFTLAVDGMANVFNAGRADSFDGFMPTTLSFAAGAGNVFTFPDVSGLVSFGGSNLSVAADGSDDGSGTTDILRFSHQLSRHFGHPLRRGRSGFS